MKTWIVMIVLLFGLGVISAKSVDVYFFYGNGCPHCAKMEPFLNKLSTKYPELNVKKYEVYFNDANRKLFDNMSKAHGKEMSGVPTVFIGNSVFVGYSNDIGKKIEEKVKECILKGCTSLTGNVTRNDIREKNSSVGLFVFGGMIITIAVLLMLILSGRRLKR